MDWATLNATLLSVFSEIACDPIDNVPEFEARWRDRAQERMSPHYGHALYLKFINVATVGNDEVRYEYDPGEDTNTATVCGMRRITLQLRSECTEETDELWALGILDRIQTRLVFPRYWDRFKDEANATFSSWGPAQDVSAKVDGRWQSMGTQDFVLFAAINETDPVPAGWIEKLLLTSDLPAPGAFVDEQLPPDP